MKPTDVIVVFWLLLPLLLHPSHGLSFETATHEIINEKATQNSSLDSFLKVELEQEFPNGIAKVINGKTVEE